MNLYGIWFNNGQLMKVTVGRPINFKTFCTTFVFDHLELTDEKTDQKFVTAEISRIEKIPDDNKPQYQLTALGVLWPA